MVPRGQGPIAIALVAVLSDDDGKRHRLGMGEAQGEPPDATGRGNLGGTAVQRDLGCLAWMPSDLELPPGDTTADARAERLGGSLLGSKARRKALGCPLLASLAVTDLPGGVHLVHEMLAEAIQACLNARHFGQIGADTKNQKGLPPRSVP